MSSQETYRTEVHELVTNRAVEMANRAVREALLDETINSYFERMLTDITGTSISVLRYSWSPFRPSALPQAGMEMSLDVQDPFVRELMMDQGLYEQAHRIAMAAFTKAMLDPDIVQDFFTAVLRDYVHETPPFYATEARV